MSRIAVTYSPVVGGSSVISLKESFQEKGSDVIDADYRQMMADIPEEKFKKLYATREGRQQLFAHAKAKAVDLLNDVDCLVLSGNSAMVDPELFNKERQEGQSYDFSRTIAELALVHVATEKGMPIMGVCGGHQVIAVHGGGEISDLNADKLDKQRFMNYDAVKINKDTMLAQIIGGKELTQDVTTTHYESEFFGAHTQFVSKLGKGFKQTATASDDQSIEAAESEFGVPILTTQFHPEIGAKGLPNAQFIYKRTQAEIDTNLKIFDYFNKAGDAYHQKKSVMDELKLFKPADDNQLINSFQIKAQQKLQENTETHKPTPQKKSAPFNWKGALGVTLAIGTLLSAALFVAFPPAGIAAAVGLVVTAALGAATGALVVGTGFGLGFGFGALASCVKDGLSNFLRNRVSDRLTNTKVTALKEKEAVKIEKAAPEDNVQSSYSGILTRIISPGEILRETPMKLWTKPDDNKPIDNSIHANDKAPEEVEVDKTVRTGAYTAP